MANIPEEIARATETDPIEFDRLDELFESAEPDERIDAIRTFDPGMQRRLYEQAEGRSVDADQIIPPERDPLEEVVHDGQNTLPAFRAFQKRFCRPPEEADSDRFWGYNEQTFRALTGPGYFVAYPDDETGEFVIDYRTIPDDKPDSWPEIMPNESRLGRFVYADTVDRLRRVTRRVTIGRAFVEDDDPMDAWFVLVRTR